MELIIKEAEKTFKTTNTYEVVLKFMSGDADGTHLHNIKFSEKKLEDPIFMETLEEFLVSFNACVTKDRRGRCGFEDPEEMIKEYKDIKNCVKYCVSALENIDESDFDDEEFIEEFGITKEEFNSDTKFKSMFMYDLPTYSEGWYDSYRDLLMYYDSEGTKFPVEIKL